MYTCYEVIVVQDVPGLCFIESSELLFGVSLSSINLVRTFWSFGIKLEQCLVRTFL